MRPVPILPIADAIKAVIKAADLTVPLAFIDLDEFWSMDSNLSQLQLPCAMLEYLGSENTPQIRHDVVQQVHHYALNYIDKVASAGSKRRPFALALSEIQQVINSGNPLEEKLAININGVEMTGLFSPKTSVSNDLKDRNLNWGQILIDVDLNSYEV